MKLYLASESVYRKELLSKLGLEFICIKPALNEEKLKAELLKKDLTPLQLAEKLSYEKGFGVFKSKAADGILISGDQLVSFQNKILGKPLTPQAAVQQLELLNNNSHQLITCITVFMNDRVEKHNHISHLKMKKLKPSEIQNYVTLDNPIDCAGSYKIERHGITLFESIDCTDFTAIQGIPMLWLSNYLKEVGVEFFKS